MDVDTALRQIDEAHRKHVGGDYEEDRERYRDVLESVESLAGGRAVEDVATYVAGHVRDQGQRPPADAVEKEGADVVRDHGEEVPNDSRLGA